MKKPETFTTKRPVRVNARRYDPDADPVEATAVAAWCGGRETPDGLLVPTLEGELLTARGSYVIEGVVGEFHPVRADIFRKTYEVKVLPVVDDPPDDHEDKDGWDRYFKQVYDRWLVKGLNLDQWSTTEAGT